MEEILVEDASIEDDVGITKSFDAWWQVELEGGDDNVQD